MKFTLVQALRGFAALWVVLHHIEGMGALSELTRHLPGFVTHYAFRSGSWGVAVFFVLSGFVIAHSLQGKEMTGGELGRFAVRRSIRLDPPYWASMLLMVAVLAIAEATRQIAVEYPTLPQVGAHLLYAQILLGFPEIQFVYWSLTYEVQFYLVYACSLLLKRQWLTNVAFYVIAFTGAVAGREWAPHGLFLNLWHGFFLGVLAYRAGRLRGNPMPLFVLAIAAIMFRSPNEGIGSVPAAGTAMLLFAAGRADGLTTLSGKPWQWLGSVSYSLYLVHAPTLILLIPAWQSIAGHSLASDAAALLMLVAASLVVAAMFCWAIERPSHNLAKRLFRKPQLERAPAFRPSIGDEASALAGSQGAGY